MVETFRLRVAARRQVTLPPKVMRLLHVSEGDVIEISVEGNSFTGRGLKLVPADLFPPERIEELKRRERQVQRGEVFEATDKEDLVAKLEKRAIPVGSGV